MVSPGSDARQFFILAIRFIDVTCKIYYPHIYYREIQNEDLNPGLKWLTENGQIDVWVHRKHDVLYNSNTQKLAAITKLPVLALPMDLMRF